MNEHTQRTLEAFVEILEPKLSELIENAVRRQMDERLISLADAAAYCGVSVAALSKRIQRGTLKAVHVGRLRRIRLSQLVIS